MTLGKKKHSFSSLYRKVALPSQGMERTKHSRLRGPVVCLPRVVLRLKILFIFTMTYFKVIVVIRTSSKSIL